MTDSPLAALLDAYVEASVNHYLASKGLFHGTLAKRDVHAARAAILAEFATLEADTGYYWNLATKMKIALDALRAEVKPTEAEEEYTVQLPPHDGCIGVWFIKGEHPPGQRVRVVRVEEGT